VNQDEYEREFGIPTKGAPGDLIKVRAALDHALDIRKFEIGLYWQRAAYFWALIAVAFAGYFAILGAEHLRNKELLSFFVSCIGLVFTWAWFQVNRGSKYWQENWENHVDMLEDPITGPLYKTTMHRPSENGLLEKHVTGPKAISVSKVNQLVSFFTLTLWVGLLVYSVIQTYPTRLAVGGELLFGCITAVFLIALYGKPTATYEDDQHHIAKKRRTFIVVP
jgi:FtsH-binding integral membrane protein